MEFDILDLALEGEFCVFDIEADGYSGQRPVELSVIRFKAGRAVDEHHWMVNPGRAISPYVSHIHGISDADVADMPPFSEIRGQVAGLIAGQVLLGHNIRDDLVFLEQGMPEAPLLPSLMVDTLRFARNVVQEIRGHSLGAVCAALGISAEEAMAPPRHAVYSNAPDRRRQVHSASVDAWMTGEAFVRMAGRVTLTAKQRRHVSQSVVYALNPRRIAAIHERIEAERALEAAPHVG